MSNRRRPLGRKRVLSASRCPDCNSEVRIKGYDATGMPWVDVAHDGTCPWYLKNGSGHFRTLAIVPGGNAS